MSPTNQRDEHPRVLISETAIRERVVHLARQISADYAGNNDLLLLGVLKGSFIFLADLSRQLTIPRQIEFIAISSYEKDQPAAAVRLEMDVRHSVENKHVLVVEDIVDTGQTLRFIVDLLQSRKPASLRTCALVRRTSSPEVSIDYVGFDIPSGWVVGYGLDYAEQYRTLPYIGLLEAT